MLSSKSNGATESPTGDLASGAMRHREAAAWVECVRAFRDPERPLPPPWTELFGPLRTGAVDDLVVLGQIGQSLDGRVATESGHSKYINGSDGLDHLHRLRALVDVVIVGVGTALADDPRLTVRRVAGPDPARVVLDPNGRLPADARMFAEDGAPRLRIVAEDVSRELGSGAGVLRLPTAAGRFDPGDILHAMAGRGWRRVLVEGGADTVSGFLEAGLLDRLHVMVAPMIFGSGRPSFVLPPIERAHQGLRVPVRTHLLGEDILFDCDFTSRRVPLPPATPPTRPIRSGARPGAIGSRRDSPG